MRVTFLFFQIFSSTKLAGFLKKIFANLAGKKKISFLKISFKCPLK